MTLLLFVAVPQVTQVSVCTGLYCIYYDMTAAAPSKNKKKQTNQKEEEEEEDKITMLNLQNMDTTQVPEHEQIKGELSKKQGLLLQQEWNKNKNIFLSYTAVKKNKNKLLDLCAACYKFTFETHKTMTAIFLCLAVYIIDLINKA